MNIKIMTNIMKMRLNELLSRYLREREKREEGKGIESQG